MNEDNDTTTVISKLVTRAFTAPVSHVRLDDGKYSIRASPRFVNPNVKICATCKYALRCLSIGPVDKFQRAYDTLPCFYQNACLDFFYKEHLFLSFYRHTYKIHTYYDVGRIDEVNNRIKNVLQCMRPYCKEKNLSNARIKTIVETLHHLYVDGERPYVHL